MTRRPYAVAMLLAVSLGLAACSGGGDPTRPVATPSASQPATAYRVATGPPVPESGAYFGAWVMPQPYTQPGRVATIERFERAMGRRLDLVHTYRKWEQSFGSEADLAFARRGDYLLLSWAGTDTRRIVSGTEDDLIRQRAREVKALPTEVLLRWRWEMDRPNLTGEVHSPRDFIRAWNHIRSIFDEEKVDNAAWVWCPLAWGFDSGRAQDYYPGDDKVDWLCADVYPENPWHKGSYEAFSALAQSFLSWSARHPKPIVIAEYGVAESYGARRAEWLADAAATAKAHPQVKAMVYYSETDAGAPAYYRFALDGDARATAALAAMGRDPWFRPPRR
jgi:hypothetical protein